MKITRIISIGDDPITRQCDRCLRIRLVRPCKVVTIARDLIEHADRYLCLLCVGEIETRRESTCPAT